MKSVHPQWTFRRNWELPLTLATVAALCLACATTGELSGSKQMQLTCPYCSFSGYWPEDGLRQYEGRARCNRCNQIFRAWRLAGEQQSATPSSSVSNSAQTEYQAALAEYNAALENLNTIRGLRGAYNSIPRPAGLSAGMKLLDLANQGTTGAAVADAERRLEVARQRLATARQVLTSQGEQAP